MVDPAPNGWRGRNIPTATNFKPSRLLRILHKLASIARFKQKRIHTLIVIAGVTEKVDRMSVNAERSLRVTYKREEERLSLFEIARN